MKATQGERNKRPPLPLLKSKRVNLPWQPRYAFHIIISMPKNLLSLFKESRMAISNDLR